MTNDAWAEESRIAAALTRARKEAKASKNAWPPMPYKVANHDQATNKYHILAAYKTQAEALAYPGGSHIIQTHGTMAELAQQRTGVIAPDAKQSTNTGAAMAQRGAVGFMLGGALGAAVGVATGNTANEPYANERWHELSPPIVTVKPPPLAQSEMPDIVYGIQ